MTPVLLATYGGSSSSAASGPSATTIHHTSCPPSTHDEAAGRCRSGLGKPFHAAYDDAHSLGAWRWWRTNLGIATIIGARRRRHIGEVP